MHIFEERKTFWKKKKRRENSSGHRLASAFRWCTYGCFSTRELIDEAIELLKGGKKNILRWDK